MSFAFVPFAAEGTPALEALALFGGHGLQLFPLPLTEGVHALAAAPAPTEAAEQDAAQHEQAQRMGVSPDQLAQHLVESDQIRVAFTEVVRGKAMDLVLANAKITDEDGNVVEQETASETEEAAKAAEAESTDGEAAEAESAEA